VGHPGADDGLHRADMGRSLLRPYNIAKGERIEKLGSMNGGI